MTDAEWHDVIDRLARIEERAITAVSTTSQLDHQLTNLETRLATIEQHLATLNGVSHRMHVVNRGIAAAGGGSTLGVVILIGRVMGWW